MLAKLSQADMIASMPVTVRGAPTRRKILLALLAEEPRTVRGLAEAVGISHPGMRGHLRRMARDKLVVVKTGTRGQPGQVKLTPGGRETAELLRLGTNAP